MVTRRSPRGASGRAIEKKHRVKNDSNHSMETIHRNLYPYHVLVLVGLPFTKNK
jgi:hypothetical protein